MDYSSPNGFITSIWGPGMWHFLHTISFNYPVKPTAQQKRDYRAFVMNIQSVLPCRYCRENFPKTLKQVPLTTYALTNRNTFSRWMYRFHKQVSAMLNKPTKLSYEDVRRMYESFRADGCSSTKRAVKKSKSKKHKGCDGKVDNVPMKCIMKIVPREMECPTFEVIKY